MQTTELVTLNNMGYRAVPANYILKLAHELSDTALPDYPAAFQKVVEQLYERFGVNAAEGDPVLYKPNTANDPYVFGIPLHVTGTPAKTPPKVPQVVKEPRLPPILPPEVSLHVEFERLVPEAVRGTNRYTNPIIEAQWQGFKLYHERLNSTLRKHQGRLLGRYVVARVTEQGVALFNETPFRHGSHALAVAEATRLATILDQGFGVFRCDQIVNKPVE